MVSTESVVSTSAVYDCLVVLFANAIMKSHQKLDVVITATVRADILRMTLASFTNKFLHQFTVRAIVNVDPVGETDKNNQMDMVNICREYFGEVIYRTPATPSFAAAVKWGWQQVQTEFFFHLEDDWILKRPVAAQPLLDLFSDENVVSVTLNKCTEHQALHDYTQFARAEYYDERHIYLLSISLNPGIFRTRYVKGIASRLDITKDPEFQFGNNNATALYPNPLFLWRVSADPLIIDTGKKWRKAILMRKVGGGDMNTEWISNDKTTMRDHIRKIKRTTWYLLRKCYWRWYYCRPLHPTRKPRCCRLFM